MALLALLSVYVSRAATQIEVPQIEAATRQELWLKRSHNGIAVALVPASQDDTALLVRLGCLDPDKVEDRRAIAVAIQTLMLTLRRMDD